MISDQRLPVLRDSASWMRVYRHSDGGYGRGRSHPMETRGSFSLRDRTPKIYVSA
jgi:hypothetical protein